MKKILSTRRNFIKKTAATTGLAAFGTYGLTAAPSVKEMAKREKLPREIWIAGISQMDLQTKTPQLMVDEMVRLVNQVLSYQPDIICLPETFVSANTGYRPSLSEKLEISEVAVQRFSAIAKENHCYIICSVFSSEGGKAYNAGIVLDRLGTRIGEYRKIHPTIGEIESGIFPGPFDAPVFQADFGKFGIQICYDIYWNDGWVTLRDKGAELVFWPSAFAAGQRVNMKAAEYGYVVASSTQKNTAKICDITGQEVTHTGEWDRGFYCGLVNLEKVRVDVWPHFRSFNDIRKKYGRKVMISIMHEEQWSVIESLSPDVFVADIVKEFDLKTFNQDVLEAEAAQIKARQG